MNVNGESIFGRQMMHCLSVVKSDRHPYLCVSIESYKRFFKSENKFSRERKIRNNGLVYLSIQ